MALSGIPWWTTDIGGFHGGDPSSPAFQELIVRWFQYGAFCPLFRLHGNRIPGGGVMSGGPNEAWSFGDKAYGIIKDIMAMREKLRPYIMQQMKRAHTHGTPPMRPLFVDFPGDKDTWAVEDQFMFGPDILVAPVLFEKQRKRDVYLPAGISWREVSGGKILKGGRTVTVDAPLERIPLFVRDGGKVLASNI